MQVVAARDPGDNARHLTLLDGRVYRMIAPGKRIVVKPNEFPTPAPYGRWLSAACCTRST
jgi:hypothetical protein